MQRVGDRNPTPQQEDAFDNPSLNCPWEAHGKPKVGRDSPAGGDAKGGAVPGTPPQERERRSQAATAVPSLGASLDLLLRFAGCSSVARLVASTSSHGAVSRFMPQSGMSDAPMTDPYTLDHPSQRKARWAWRLDDPQRRQTGRAIRSAPPLRTVCPRKWANVAGAPAPRRPRTETRLPILTTFLACFVAPA